MPTRASRLSLVVAGVLSRRDRGCAADGAQAWLHVQITGTAPSTSTSTCRCRWPSRYSPWRQTASCLTVSSISRSRPASQGERDARHLARAHGCRGHGVRHRRGRQRDGARCSQRDQIEVRVEDRGGDSDETVEVQLPIAVVDACSPETETRSTCAPPSSGLASCAATLSGSPRTSGRSASGSTKPHRSSTAGTRIGPLDSGVRGGGAGSRTAGVSGARGLVKARPRSSSSMSRFPSWQAYSNIV